MADSLCGPSNALQNFQKHSTVDRTLQQDRLISRPSRSQGFRSSLGQNAGLIESEFQAFQAGNLPPGSHQGFQQPFSHAPPPQPGPAAWASDFQHMHISSPPPELAQQPYNGQPQQTHDTGGWHQDFARQFNAEQRVMAQSSQLTGSPAYGYSPMNGGMRMGMQSQFPVSMMGQHGEQIIARQENAEAFDEEAFARAFEEAAKEEQAQNGLEMGHDHDMGMAEDAQVNKSAMEFGQDIMLDASAERFMSSNEPQIPNQARLGADLIHDPMSEVQERPEQEDPDALARTAGQLLDSVRTNQSSKFQNSEFLGLMKQLRDREVMVRGDNIVGANEGGGVYKNELLDLFWSLRKLVFGGEMMQGEQIRSVLTILLQLNDAASSGITGIMAKSPSYWKAQRILQAVINLPDVAALPALRNLAQFTLLTFENIEKGKSNTPPSPLSSELEAIRTANAEITSILPVTETALETLIYNYISDSLQPKKFSQEHLNRLLGYTFTELHGNSLHPTSGWSPHIQRTRDIMGPAISETIGVCGGFWGPLLSTQDFFALVAAHQLHGGVKSKGFKKLLREIEEGIEEGLKAAIERVKQGFPYRFGVATARLKNLVEASYEDHLQFLEAISRLRMIQVYREPREAEEMKGRKEERRTAFKEGRHPNQSGGRQ